MKSMSIRVVAALAALLVVAGCEGNGQKPADAGAAGGSGGQEDGGPSADGVVDITAGADADAGTDADAAPPGPDFSAVEAALVARAASAGVANLGLSIWDAQDHEVYEHMLGSFTAGTRVAVASASKLVAGLVLFDVIRRGLLTLDSTTGAVLGWTGPNAAITLRHLLSFTSGLPRETACTVNPLMTLSACAATVASATAATAPGAEFDYGSTHLLVAAAMAEQVTGQPWAELFAATLRTPLGLPADVAYFTAPRQAIGMINPLVAGGLRATVDEYHAFLAVAFHRGVFGPLTVGTPALFDAQAREPFPDVPVGYSPWPAFHYGLASWLVCATPVTGCDVLASPGAFGFTPWYDRATGYYAILGMELSSTGNDEGVVEFAVNLQQELEPLIATAISAAP